MSQDAPATAPAASLFQKAYSQMVLQQRLDAQLATLLEQRRKAQEELEATQSQINEEFERLKRESEEAPVRLMNSIAKMGSSGATTAEQLHSSMASLHSLREERTGSSSSLRGNGGAADLHKSKESREEAESAT